MARAPWTVPGRPGLAGVGVAERGSDGGAAGMQRLPPGTQSAGGELVGDVYGGRMVVTHRWGTGGRSTAGDDEVGGVVLVAEDAPVALVPAALPGGGHLGEAEPRPDGGRWLRRRGCFGSSMTKSTSLRTLPVGQVHAGMAEPKIRRVRPSSSSGAASAPSSAGVAGDQAGQSGRLPHCRVSDGSVSQGHLACPGTTG